MASNRFYVLYFPFGYKPLKKIPKTGIAVFISILSVSVYTSLTLQEGCRYVYDPGYFQWRPETGECGEKFLAVSLYGIITCAITSNTCNVATVVRLLMNKMVGLSKEASKQRRKRWLIMFVQSVIQDCLHLIDIINVTYVWELCDEPWFQFLFLTLSFIIIYTLDGFVMLVCHKDIHPKWWKRFIQKKTIGGTSVMASILGTICNIYLLVKFLARKEKPNGFQKICLIKTIPNIIVCISFIFWVVPTTALSLTYDQLPYRLNSLIGSLAGNWSYVLTPMMQVCMACNRFYVLYFPFGIKAVKRVHVTEIFIVISMIFVTFLSSLNIPEGCGYVFDPEYFQWRPEFEDCSHNLTDIFLYSIIIFTTVSNSFNVATAVRLVTMKNKMVGMNKEEAKKRRSRWLIMFTQSVIQDCLHLFDILNSVYLWKMSVDAWFQFLCLTLSFIVIYTLDGIVMLICHKDVHPTWCKTMMNKSATASNSVHVVIHS